jgi:small subunit ribosomal protein S2
MKRLPDAIIVVDVDFELTAVKEARLLEIPVIAIVDTNTNPQLVDYPIPANDDSIRTIQLIIAAVSDEILQAIGKEKEEQAAEKVEEVKEEKEIKIVKEAVKVNATETDSSNGNEVVKTAEKSDEAVSEETKETVIEKIEEKAEEITEEKEEK